MRLRSSAHFYRGDRGSSSSYCLHFVDTLVSLLEPGEVDDSPVLPRIRGLSAFVAAFSCVGWLLARVAHV